MVSVPGNSLRELASALVPELGLGQPVTLSSDSGAANILVAASMVDTEAPVEKHGGRYFYCIEDSGAGSRLGQQQRVKKNGFTGATGTFTTAANFTGNTQSGSRWLLSATMPILDQDELTGVRTCVNRAIRKLWYRHWWPLTAVSGQDQYDLGALWWAARDRFVRLMDPDPSGTGHPAVAAQWWDVVQNGDVWTLQLGSGYPADQVFWLVVDAPLNFRLRINDAWANQASPTAGLVGPGDACLGEWNHVFQCSLYECMKQLALQAGGNRKAYWAEQAAIQRAVVAAIKGFQMDDDGDGLDPGPSVGAGSWGSAWGMKSLWNY